jgi:isoleucyl-tRNA synthetase
MSDKSPKPDSGERDYSETLFLPKTEFPMRAGLPQREPQLLERWAKMRLYQRLREAGKDRPKFTLHDGPPYANGNIHIGHALNKILKDVVTRSQQMLGHDSNYVPGWDCHGLPIEWKIEEENYRSKNKKKPDLSDPAAMIAFRKECRAYAGHWLNVQREEFKRLGVEGDWDKPYTTMSFAAEAQIARELMTFAANGTLYRGSKPVMWSVVEKTALAEAEVEYEDYTSDTVWVKFPVSGVGNADLSVVMPGLDPGIHDLLTGKKDVDGRDKPGHDEVSIVIWTTTPWTLPGNRAISFSPKVEYGLYKVTDAPPENWAKFGDLLILSKNLAGEVFKQAKVAAYDLVQDIPAEVLAGIVASHPLKGMGYTFPVPLLAGDHVTDDTGTGFVHTAPGHGREDFDIWTANARALEARGINPAIPYTVDENGAFTAQAPGFEGKRVITDKGEKGDANEAVIKALAEAGNIIARGRLKHQYPHSWRSKKPVIFRNTPQWFIAMDKTIAGRDETLRQTALREIKTTRWVPAAGENRITGMIEGRPDWVISRQRAWGVPIAVFVRETGDGSAEILRDDAVNKRIADAFESEGADAWYAEGARERFLGSRANEDWKKVDDILDVWFDSGSTHAFVLEDAERFPSLAGIKRRPEGTDRVMYLEGSDQHRGWFQSSLLESCGTRGRAPFDVVLTHGFVLDEQGRKMSKSLGNVTAPQDVMKNAGADILRMWVCASDYSDDLRIGPEILKGTVETYRKLRNTIRWMLGSLGHFREEDRIAPETMPELERLMLHRLSELDDLVRKAYADFDYKRIFAALSHFMTTDLSAFYFDIRKDALYCDPVSSRTRKAALTVIDHLFRCTVTWLAPMLCFTAEEAWLSRYGDDGRSVHLETFPEVPPAWRHAELAEKWAYVREVRRAITEAMELARAAKKIGSSLEAHLIVEFDDGYFPNLLKNVDMAEVCITSEVTIQEWVPSESDSGDGSEQDDLVPPYRKRLRWMGDAFSVIVRVRRASGRKCARSWKVSTAVGSDPHYPDVTPRDAQALREWDAIRKAAE